MVEGQVGEFTEQSPLIKEISAGKEVFWENPAYLKAEEANRHTKYSMKDIEDVEARLQRFASYIQIAFPETQKMEGIIESELMEIPSMRNWLNEVNEETIQGKLWLKRDDLLPISGTIKARGAIYEVLKHAETIALEQGMLNSIEEDYAIFASDEFKAFFAQHHIAVGTTGNLGISVGTMGSKLGFNVTVHMSVEAKQWKKDYLRSKGVKVIEHDTNFSKAVEQGREESNANPNSYFVDDEHSEELFLGYTVGGYRMKKQLDKKGIKVDENHPLFVYLPCGIGGSPSGITFGMKQAFGDHVHCIFAEPTKMPSMLVGLDSRLYDEISVEEIGLGGLTVADGLAVPRTSGLVAKLMHNYFSAGYSIKDDIFRQLLFNLYDKETIFLEPAAVAGLVGPQRLLGSEAGKHYIQRHHLTNKLSQATHIAWATGGSMVPEENKKTFLKEGQSVSEQLI
ncbi:D-serine ammonia-lyase [Marinilactibacillus sp. Marseille-P9653]|uniref:D-serine ammonia-lyase n=1 Tax=Marinilactibacillus sp. Marseille-P9653 TaxID=2866583 RepID=UPI001CE3F033|nr:D-serine ammonia-lyase [Marinilactibacillus sp. Marseille-P9653]